MLQGIMLPDGSSGLASNLMLQLIQTFGWTHNISESTACSPPSVFQLTSNLGNINHGFDQNLGDHVKNLHKSDLGN